MSKRSKIRSILAVALLPVLLLAMQAFGQSNSSLSGTVVDASQAVLPGATVTATNSQTGVTTTALTNDAGNYNFPSLQPGVYKVSVEMPSFQTQTKTDVRLGVASQARLNFELAIAGSSTTLEVTTTAQDMLIETSSSTGTVLQQQTVNQLPLVSNDVMDLINTMGGVVKAEDPIFGASTQTFAGVSSGNINITRDGVSVNEVRYTSGIVSPSRINQEMVGEFKMILSPVDAEMGRGAGQVQILTKSGANTFHGSGVWNIQNTALDAREFEANRIDETPAWRNLHNYTLSFSGPIIKNKTFFFASWDQQLVRSKAWVTANALTNCARKGIYRYFPNVVGTNADDNSNYAANQFPHAQAVAGNWDGMPRMVVPDGWNYAGTGLTVGQTLGVNDLRYKSIFGPLSDAAMAQIALDPVDCSQYEGPSAINPRAGLLAEGGSFDTYRTGWDQTGYVDKFLALLPEANYYGAGDGLNTAGYKWYRATSGSNNIFGTGEDNRRKSITIKIDHNINAAHRLSGTYTLEKNIGEDGGPVWPENSYIGANWRKPQSLTASLTSTLTPSLLNEFRFGLSRLTGYVMSSRDTDSRLDPILNDLTSGIDMPNYTIDTPVVVSYDSLGFGPGSNYASGISHPYASRGIMNSTWGGTDHRWTFADTITWLKGAHSFKGGFEMRLAKSWYTTDGEGGFYATSSTAPIVTGGDNSNNFFTAAWGGWPSWAADGVLGSRFSGASNQWSTITNMLNFLAGSVTDVRQYFYVVNDGDTVRWNNVLAGENQYINDIRTREFSFFFKDDWKVNSDLTLNLGVRYEYYGVPWNETGMSAVLAGGSSSILGISGASPWMSWLGMAADGNRTEYAFVGPNSANPDRSVWNKDMNNFAPHVGFSWQLPWFGKGKTTLRGGYSISYSPLSNADGYKGIIGAVPGTSYRFTGANGSADPYISLDNVGDYVGTFYPATEPMATITDRATSVSVYDDNIRNPYIQSLNVSLTRQISNALTLDVRYIGTLARSQTRSVNVNTPRYMDNGLFEEFEYARRWDGVTPVDTAQIPLLSQIFPEAPGQNSIQQLMSVFSMSSYQAGRSMLLNGNYSGLASAVSEAGTVGSVRGTKLNESGLPENLIYTNPQFSSANITRNDGKTNYHSMQAQLTMRPTRGLSFQTTYTWSRNLIDQGVGNYLTGERRYYLSGQHRSHTLTAYGSYELPFGANGFLFRDASGAVKKAIEGWSLSWIANITSGLPGSLSGASSFWGISDPVVVDPDNWDNKAGKVTWEPGAENGWFFGNKYKKVLDPQCSDGTISDYLKGQVGSCNLRALALASDESHIVIRNARPGEIGNLSPNSLTGPGRWTLDMAMSKSIEFMEGKRLELRVDAQNIFNHPIPSNSQFAWNARFTQISNPEFGLNSGSELGYLSTKGTHRTFQAKIRISF